MSKNTSIEWCDHTFNPWFGCTKVSPGCDHCYAEARMDTRLHRVNWGPGQPRVRTQTWGDPVKWNKQHEAFFAQHGRRQRVFCASLADVFDNEVDPQWRADLFDLIAKTPNLDWLLLTKRIGNAKTMMADALHLQPEANRDGMIWPLPNVWLGATIVNQPEYDRDIGKLLRTPAAVHFLSVEPMLGAIDMRMGGASIPDYSDHRPLPKLDWVIVGGESGHGARPMHPDWARSLRDQCHAAGVPFLFKQWGEWLPLSHQTGGADPEQRQCHIWPDGRPYDGETEDMTPECVQLSRVGKKAAGRLLDGRTWDEVPS